MASDSAAGGRMPGRRDGVPGFRWVSSSPSPAEVALLVESFPEVVRLPVSELEEEAAAWQSRTVIAQSFHKWVPAEALIREFRRAGVSGEITPINLASRCHLFCFESPEVRNQILQRPWVVNGQVIGTEEWRPEFTPAEDSIKSALVWVRLPNLPLEFWKEGFLKAILESAGSFVSVDAATLVKNRGGFARVCLRIDLTRPLRPGVRVQGLFLPFWQPFVYECLEGVCLDCGMLHLGGACSASVKGSGGCSASNQALGPWLIAVRQRSPISGPSLAAKGSQQLKPSGSPSVSKIKHHGNSSGRVAAEDGWSSPAKLARRRSSMTGKPARIPGEGSSHDEGALESGIAGMGAVPVTVESAGTVPNGEAGNSAAKELCLNISVFSKNPFASLAPVEDVEGSMVSRDTFPGPVKRARPEVPAAPRSFPKLEKRKGKGKVYPSKNGRLFGLPSVQEELSLGNQEGGMELIRSPSSISAGCSAENAGGIIEGLARGSLSEGQPSCSFETGSGMEGQSACSVLMSDSIMIEDQSGSQPPSNCK